MIRPITGVKAHLHAVIDNFSRRILAWRLAEKFDPLTTIEVLAEAGKAIDYGPEASELTRPPGDRAA